MPHYHDTYELYYMLNGRTTYFIDDEIYSVEKGNFVFVPKGVIHNTDNENCKNNERLLVCFGEECFEGKARELLLELYIQELLAFICRYRCERKVHIRESDKIIYSVSEYVRRNFDQDITLESLSRTFAVSEGYLSRKFKLVTGIGLNQYITFVRISNGERLLRESSLSVTEVAEKCGYNDSNYFAAVFKRIKGVTPLRYRKQKTSLQEG